MQSCPFAPRIAHPLGRGRRRRAARLPLLAALGLWACSSALDLRGKACDAVHPCPDGLVCDYAAGSATGACRDWLTTGDRDGVDPDGGDPGGGDPGGGDTTGGDTRTDEQTPLVSVGARALVALNADDCPASITTPPRTIAAGSTVVLVAWSNLAMSTVTVSDSIIGEGYTPHAGLTRAASFGRQYVWLRADHPGGEVTATLTGTPCDSSTLLLVEVRDALAAAVEDGWAIDEDTGKTFASPSLVTTHAPALILQLAFTDASGASETVTFTAGETVLVADTDCLHLWCGAIGAFVAPATGSYAAAGSITAGMHTQSSALALKGR